MIINSIYLSEEENKRIQFFDRLMTLGTEELNEIMAVEETIWRLKGEQKPTGRGPISQLVNNNNMMAMKLVDLETKLNNLQSDLITSRMDLTTLVKAVHRITQVPYDSDWNTLKQKNGLY